MIKSSKFISKGLYHRNRIENEVVVIALIQKGSGRKIELLPSHWKGSVILLSENCLNTPSMKGIFSKSRYVMYRK